MGTAEAERLAEQIVRQATASSGGETRARTTSSYGEFRSATAAGRPNLGTSQDLVFWKYLTAPGGFFDGRTSADEPDWAPQRYLIEPLEHRTLSRATGAAGGFAVPSDFDTLITSARRARNVIGNVSRVLVTDHGRPIPLPTAHGTGAWTAENAAVTASDDTFAQVTLNAYKGMTKTIVSEELVQDALANFDEYLGDELGQRLALLEESAFAVGDGSGKPQGVVATGNGVATVAAATGSATGFKLADVRTVWAALPPAYEPNASWIMSPSASASLANLTDTAGGLVLPSLHAAEPTLYGRPVYQSPELPAAAANARSVVVGDFSVGYAVRRVTGLGLHRQTELHSDSGQIGYRLCSLGSTAASFSRTRFASSPTAPPRAMLLERLRRRMRHEQASRQHPTPQQAYDRLAAGLCMYAGLTKCSSAPYKVGLRDWDDENDVLACKAHIGRLRKLDGRRLDELERHLTRAFAGRRAA